MIITLHWWILPIAISASLIIVGIALARKFGGPQQGSYDFVTPMITMFFGVAGILAAIVFTIGFFTGRWTK